MDTIFEIRDVLLALSDYIGKFEQDEVRKGELEKLFEEIANDKIVLIRKDRK